VDHAIKGIFIFEAIYCTILNENICKI